MSCAAAAVRGEGASSPGRAPAPQSPAAPNASGGGVAATATGEPLGEHITRLFPKCRPRRDVNLNPMADGAAVQRLNHNDHDRLIMVADVSRIGGSSDEDQTDCNITTHVPHHNSKHEHYKFRDSRIIEIAGGREVYSQSRTKAVRKMRQSNNIHKVSQQQRHKHRTVKDVTAVHDKYTMENSSPQNIISPIQDYSFRQLTTLDQVCVLPRETPPPLDPPLATNLNHKGSPIAVVADGEVVVFDDISDNWKGLRLDMDGSEDDCNKRLTPVNGLKSETSDSSGSSPSRGPDPDSGGIEGGGQSDISDTSAWSGTPGKVTRVIGGLPIAEYEGSPRRYGVAPPQPHSPRPGFPQRISAGDVSPSNANQQSAVTTTFDYLYEFSETRKVLEEFFRCPTTAKPNLVTDITDDFNDFQDLDYELKRQRHDVISSEPGNNTPLDNQLDGADHGEGEGEVGEQDGDSDAGGGGSWYVGRRLASESPRPTHNHTNFLGLQEHDNYEREVNIVELSVGTGSSGSGSRGQRDMGGGLGLSVGPGITPALAGTGPSTRFNLSPETTDCDSNCGDLDSEVSLMMENELRPSSCEGIRLPTSMPVLEDGLSSGHASDNDNNNSTLMTHAQIHKPALNHAIIENGISLTNDVATLSDADLNSLDPLAPCEVTPPPPAPAPHRGGGSPNEDPPSSPLASIVPASVTPNVTTRHDVNVALHDVRAVLRGGARTINVDVVPRCDVPVEQIWVPRRRATSGESIESAERKPMSGDEDEADTDLETDRLLGQQRTDDQGFYDDKRKKRKTLSSAKTHQQQGWRKSRSRTVLPSIQGGTKPEALSGLQGTQVSPDEAVPPNVEEDKTCTVNGKKSAEKEPKKKGKNKEVMHGGRHYSSLPSTTCDKKSGVFHAPEVLIEGVLFRARYLGSTQLACEGQPTKATRMMQAEEAVSRIKAPEGETQPSTEVDLFISTEKIMVLNTELKEIMMDHALRTISYIADIGDLVVLMARRRFMPHDSDSDPPKLNRTPKMICHVFESEEAQFIAQSIGQAFQVAYMEFLKANGIEDHSFVKEMDYQEVLNSQEIFGDELQMFAKKELQKEVVVPKTKGEILGVVVVESGWGSMLPTVVIANLAPAGAAARCGQLNIGDQIIAINGVSLVGLPLSTCQTYIKNSKNQTVVKLTVVPCPPVVEVKIKRPDTKYQLGFSVQNGVICSLLRGGIAERGGVRVGHRIIEINSQSVVAVPHERIVNLLATSVGEILMKTMPTSMFRLLTGQENPVYI